MSGITGVSNAAQSMFTAAAASKAKVAAPAVKAMDSDGDNDGSRPGEVEAGKGSQVDRQA